MAAAAYKRFPGSKIGEMNTTHYIYTTNTLASTLVANFFDAELGRMNVGDWVFIQKVDDLTKANLATWAVSDAAVYVVVGGATHVDLAILYTSAFTNAT